MNVQGSRNPRREGATQVGCHTRRIFALCAACFIFVLSASAQSTTTYAYAGNAFNVPQCQALFGNGVNCVGGGSITATFTFKNLPAGYTGAYDGQTPSFSISGIGLSISSDSPYSSLFPYSFIFSHGSIVGWEYIASWPDYGVVENLDSEGGSGYVCICDFAVSYLTTPNTVGAVVHNAGIWTLTSRQTGGTPLQITTTTLPSPVSGHPYSAEIKATGGSGSGHSWSVSSGSLPPGFALSSEDNCGSGCVILSSTGTPPARPDSYNFTVQVTDSTGNLATQPLTLVVATRAVPTTFQQVWERGTDGVLYLYYTWASSSGNPDDLADCMVGEKVTYSGESDTYIWPDPWYFSTPNPTILWKTGKQEWLLDTLHDWDKAPVRRPYARSLFDGVQEFRYQCEGQDQPSDFPGWSGITIERSIEDTTGNGCWVYTVTKYSINKMYGTASARLPGVPGDCPIDQQPFEQP